MPKLPLHKRIDAEEQRQAMIKMVKNDGSAKRRWWTVKA